MTAMYRTLPLFGLLHKPFFLIQAWSSWVVVSFCLEQCCETLILAGPFKSLFIYKNGKFYRLCFSVRNATAILLHFSFTCYPLLLLCFFDISAQSDVSERKRLPCRRNFCFCNVHWAQIPNATYLGFY